jgi:hypothetical protein
MTSPVRAFLVAAPFPKFPQPERLPFSQAQPYRRSPRIAYSQAAGTKEEESVTQAAYPWQDGKEKQEKRLIFPHRIT